MISRTCVSSCSNSFAYDLNRSCVSFCPSPTYAVGNQCVDNCSIASKYSDDSTRTCAIDCPPGYYKD